MATLSHRSRTAILVILTGIFFINAQREPTLAGQWEGERSGSPITVNFLRNGVFSLTTSADEVRGHYTRTGETLSLLPDGHFLAEQYAARFDGPDVLLLESTKGERITLKRKLPPLPVRPGVASDSSRLTPVIFERAWEPNEKAFSLLIPQGWKIAGGVFQVDPARMNGNGNSTSPKCDLGVSRDSRGTVMVRWIPEWNYADLSRNAMGPGIIRPGQNYNGMLVRPIPDARSFLSELFRTERPQATAIRVMAEDPIVEIGLAFAQKAETVNAMLRQTGLDPMRFDSRAIVLEYQEAGVSYRECLFTTIVDSRSGASAWSNENTLRFRAPAAEFEAWKPILDVIRSSREPNGEWLQKIEKSAGANARAAWETQYFVAGAAASVWENRRSANTETGMEPWLFMNTRTGFQAIWESDRGEILYAGDPDFDPNRSDLYKSRQWKRMEK
jgi:hypothetical protein